MRALASVGVLLLVFAMKRLALALMATALVLSAAKADETCKAEAREHNFTGEELQTYMANCKAVAAMVCCSREARGRSENQFQREMHQGRRGQVIRRGFRQAPFTKSRGPTSQRQKSNER